MGRPEPRRRLKELRNDRQGDLRARCVASAAVHRGRATIDMIDTAFLIAMSVHGDAEEAQSREYSTMRKTCLYEAGMHSE